MIDRERWTEGGFAERVMAADQLLKTAPDALTDRDIADMDAYHGNGAQARYARDTARMKAMAPPAAAAPSRARWSLKTFERWHAAVADYVFKDWGPEGQTDKSTQYSKAVADAIDEIAPDKKDAQDRIALVMPVLASLHAINTKNHMRNERLDDLEACVKRLEGLLVLAHNEIKNLETSTTKGMGGAAWGGEWERGKSYTAGEFVGRKGSIWTALQNTSTEPGSSLDDWDLVMPGSTKP